MNKKTYVYNKQAINKIFYIAIVIASVVVIVICAFCNLKDKTNLNEAITRLHSEVFPVITYEKYYGSMNSYHVSDSIPEYFYESEDTVSQDTIEQLEAPVEEAINPTVEAPNNTGVTYTREQLSSFDFLSSNFYVIDSTTYLDPAEMDVNTLLDMDMSIDVASTDYKVLIYHTHGSEAFADSRPGVTEDTIIGVGDTLTSILHDKYGINVYHDRSVYDTVDGVLDRNYAYTLARGGIDKILSENPSIDVVIDLHRDGVNEDTHLITYVDGKPTAKVMFLNGVSRLSKNGDIAYLYNPNKQANLAFSLQMHLAGSEMYSDFLRRIYIRGYKYNLDVRPRATLIEAGAQTNTVEEMNNAMDPLAAIIYKVLSGEK